MAEIGATYLGEIVRGFKTYKKLGDAALAATPDAHLNTELDANSNSIAVVVKHVGGNLRSRFRDFLTSDGEKPDRNRDSEFEVLEPASRETIQQWWDEGWATAFAAITALTPADLEKTVTIRGEQLAVVEALNRSVAHIAYHVGQIVYLARHFAGPAWKSLTIPKGESAKYSAGNYKK